MLINKGLKRNILGLILLALLIMRAGTSYAGEYNLVLLPSIYCHQAGLETKVSDKYTLGFLGRLGCVSERPTYGTKNSEVESKFSRVLVPLKYSFKGAFNSGPFVQGLVGIEKSKFESDSGSTADVTFFNSAIHGGYNWYFRSGFNVSTLVGVAYLHEISSSKQISTSESPAVVYFLDNNTKSNTHIGAGVIVGWLF